MIQSHDLWGRPVDISPYIGFGPLNRWFNRALLPVVFLVVYAVMGACLLCPPLKRVVQDWAGRH